eukprot:4355509-Prymnesium_polylepis.1
MVSPRAAVLASATARPPVHSYIVASRVMLSIHHASVSCTVCDGEAEGGWGMAGCTEPVARGRAHTVRSLMRSTSEGE